jgi:hypothetical protein
MFAGSRQCSTAPAALERELANRIRVVSLNRDEDLVVRHGNVGRQDLDAQLFPQGWHLLASLSRKVPNLLVRRRAQVRRVHANNEVLRHC